MDNLIFPRAYAVGTYEITRDAGTEPEIAVVFKTLPDKTKRSSSMELLYGYTRNTPLITLGT